VAVDLRGLPRRDEDEVDGYDVLEGRTPRDLCDLEYVKFLGRYVRVEDLGHS
jgi:hypothetical protein